MENQPLPVIYIFSRNFDFTKYPDESSETIQEWIKRYPDTLEIDDILLKNTPNYIRIDAADRQEFVTSIKEYTCRDSSAITLDVLRFNQSYGWDTAMVVVWSGDIVKTDRRISKYQEQHHRKKNKSLEEKKLANDERKRKHEEKLKQLKLEGKCLACGKPLSKMAKLFRYETHFSCTDRHY